MKADSGEKLRRNQRASFSGLRLINVTSAEQKYRREDTGLKETRLKRLTGEVKTRGASVLRHSDACILRWGIWAVVVKL